MATLENKKEETQKYEERNKSQKRVYVNKESLNIIFGEGTEEDILCYGKILNLCRQKITKYFRHTTDFAQKEELAYLTLYRVYVALFNKIQRLEQKGEKAELFFYLSQFYSYIDIAARTQVMIYKNYLKKVQNRTMNYDDDVNYDAPLEELLNHSLIDYNTEDMDGEDFCVSETNINSPKDPISQTEQDIDYEVLKKQVQEHFTEKEMQAIQATYYDNETLFDGSKKELNKVMLEVSAKINADEEIKWKMIGFIEGMKK